ncbi:hypothetical protein ACMAZF_06640 [Psychrobium sp. nBUS_13]|uniref:hypothetical protein n=1 Tax=Psychrobium sp. nBUS_13 TaxID=3395319 RepID=UPI003EBEE4A7
MRLIFLIAILLLQSVSALHAKDVVFVGHITDEKNNYLSDVTKKAKKGTGSAPR